MALLQVDFMPDESVWIVDAFNRVLAGTIRSVMVSVNSLTSLDPLGDPDLESPYQTTTTTTAPTTTAAPSTTALPSSSPPIVTTTAAPTTPPASTPAPSTGAPSTPPPSTLAPEPILDEDDVVITVVYLVDVMVSGSIRVLTVDESRVFAEIEDATAFVTAQLQ